MALRDIVNMKLRHIGLLQLQKLKRQHDVVTFTFHCSWRYYNVVVGATPHWCHHILTTTCSKLYYICFCDSCLLFFVYDVYNLFITKISSKKRRTTEQYAAPPPPPQVEAKPIASTAQSKMENAN